jgi:8-oxo-dGTP diphosphatase
MTGVPSTDINADIVEQEIARLQTKYDDVITETKYHDSPSDLFEEHTDYARDGYIGGAYVWVVRPPENAPLLSPSMSDADTDDRDRVLMILNRGSEEWDLPGGGREDGETFEEAAVREVEEETNIRCELTELFLLHHAVVTTDHREERVHTLYVYFDGSYTDGDIAIQGGELNGAAWFAEPPERLDPVTDRRAEEWYGE